MKVRTILAMLVLMSLVLSACQSKSNEPPALPTSPSGSSPTATYPPPTAASVAVPGPAMYPDAKTGDTVTWDQVTKMVLNGEASKIALDPSLKVTLALKDGRQFFSLAPAKEELDKVVKACGDICKSLQVTTQ